MSLFCPHRVPWREFNEFLSACYLCTRANSLSALLNSLSLPKNSERVLSFERVLSKLESGKGGWQKSDEKSDRSIRKTNTNKKKHCGVPEEYPLQTTCIVKGEALKRGLCCSCSGHALPRGSPISTRSFKL